VCPGADAATAALLASGLGAGRWSFEGFLPARGAARRRRLAGIGGEAGAVVLFEAPHRLRRTLADLAEHAGAGRGVLVANDLTKRFERTWRGTVGTVGEQVGTGEPRGEFVIVLAPADRTGPRRGPTPAGGSAPAGV
jgi:16S rRNA (cytidine1402-2'-O)-methyltransferase